MKILVAEDDAAINKLLGEILSGAGYEPVQAYSGTEAKMILDLQRLSLVILDLMLPGLTGAELLPYIKAKADIPVLILSARDTPQDKTAFLRAGADDYMTKPFDDEELLARIEVLLRRHGHPAASVPLQFRDIELDPDGRTVKKSGRPINLTAREFDILELLMTNPQKVFTKSNLYQSIWNDEFIGDDNTVNVHISNLRTKLGAGEYIQTVWGIGFKLKHV